MSTKEISRGGVFLALLMGVSLVFISYGKAGQSLAEIVKIVIVAKFASESKGKTNVAFAIAVMIMSLIILPLQIALVYHVPVMINGIVLGMLLKSDIKQKFVLFFVVEFLMYIYEIAMYGIFFGINIFALYQDDCNYFIEMVFTEEKYIQMVGKYIKILTWGYLFVSAIFGSAVTYFFSKKVLKVMKGEN